MKLLDLKNNDAFELISEVENLDMSIAGIECCDLLSWVMANGKEGEAWITVQIHSNIVAVATLLDFSCIIVPEGIKVDDDVLEKAKEEEVAVFSTKLDAYGIFKVFHENGI
jgi:hypothetical protein